MRLRELQPKDAPLILEWMKDSDLNCFFRFDSNCISLQSVEKFIAHAQDSKQNRHFAVVLEDQYMGTISLKNIDSTNQNAEYAISMRKCAIGTGLAKQATIELLRIAFEELDLHKVYLNVYSDNIRAIKFYEKIGFEYEGVAKDQIIVNGAYKNLHWFGYIKP